MIAAFNQSGPIARPDITVNFAAPSAYNYELDHFSTDPADMTLALTQRNGLAETVAPPVARLQLTAEDPDPEIGATTLIVAAFDYANQAVAGLAVNVTQTGANTNTATGTTATDGRARLTIEGTATGVATVQAGAVILGNDTISNTTPITWQTSANPPIGTGPGPIIADPTSTDGATITEPTAFSVATVTPQPGTTINRWRLTLRAAGSEPGDPQTRELAAGIGAPPINQQLALIDPTVLSNGNWTARVEAVDSANNQDVLDTGVIVGERTAMTDQTGTTTYNLDTLDA